MEKVQSETWVGAMTETEILELAKEDRVRSEYTEFGWQDCDRYEFDANELIAFARAVQEKTRDECAEKFEEMQSNGDAWVSTVAASAAIRSMTK